MGSRSVEWGFQSNASLYNTSSSQYSVMGRRGADAEENRQPVSDIVDTPTSTCWNSESTSADFVTSVRSRHHSRPIPFERRRRLGTASGYDDLGALLDELSCGCESDPARTTRSAAAHEFGCGPSVWTGRALQAESDDLEKLVLRICIRPIHGAFELLAIMDIRACSISFAGQGDCTASQQQTRSQYDLTLHLLPPKNRARDSPRQSKTTLLLLGSLDAEDAQAVSVLALHLIRPRLGASAAPYRGLALLGYIADQEAIRGSNIAFERDGLVVTARDQFSATRLDLVAQRQHHWLRNRPDR